MPWARKHQVRPQWAPDPTLRHGLRWWDGTRWTGHVADDSWLGIDPLPAPRVALPPADRRTERFATTPPPVTGASSPVPGRPSPVPGASSPVAGTPSPVAFWRRGSRAAGAGWAAAVGVVVIAALALDGAGGRHVTPAPQAVASPARPTATVSATRSTTPAPAQEPTGGTRSRTITATAGAGATLRGVRAGTPCSRHGAYGRTGAGKLVRCTASATDVRYRWRAV